MADKRPLVIQSGQTREIDTGDTLIATTFTGDFLGTINTATIGVTQSPGDSSKKMATCEFVAAAVLVEDLWDRVTGTPNYLLPKTVTDDIGATGARINKIWATDIDATTFSGDLLGTINTATTGVTQSPGNNSTLIATTAYVDAAVLIEDLWDRTGTTLSPKNAGDDLTIAGWTGLGGAATAELTEKLTVAGNTYLSGELNVNAGGVAPVNTTPPFTSAMSILNDNLDGVAGVGMQNTSNGVAADFRFVVWNNDATDYLAFSMPSDANTGTLFGQTRGGVTALFTNGSRKLCVGTFATQPIIFGTGNVERMRIGATGGLRIGRTTAIGSETLTVEGDIAATGFVGIGTATAPANPLDVRTTLDANIDPSLTAGYAQRIYQSGGSTGTGQGIVFVHGGLAQGSIISTDRGAGNSASLDFYVDGGATYDMVMRIEQDGSLGLGTLSTNTVNEKLHVNVNGVSGFTGGVDQGILITDTLNPRVVFEDVGDAPTKRVMEICYNDQSLRIQSLWDDGSLPDVANIAVFSHDGNVGFGVNVPSAKFEVVSPTTSIPTVALGRKTGQASIIASSTAANGVLIMDSIANFIGINYYSSDNIVMALGVDGTPGRVCIGVDTPDTSAVLDVVSTTSGFLPPRMTATQRDAISTPTPGLQVYNSDNNHLNVFDGAVWMDIGSIPANTYVIWTVADLPNAPSGGKIILPSGRYLWMQDITISDNFEIEDAASVQWVMPNGYANSMTWTGTGTMVSTEAGGSGAFRILDQGITIYLSQNNVTLFDITGTLGVVFAFFGFQGTGGSMGQMIGSSTGVLTSRRFFWLNSSASGWTTGLTVDGSNRISMDTGTITSHVNAAGAFLIQDQAQAFANFARMVFNVNNVNASAFDIRPMNTNDTAISRIDLGSSIGTFFAAGTTGAITAIADATNGPNAITSVQDNGGSVQFNGAGAAGYEVGSVVTLSGFAESTYNVVGRVTGIVSTFNFVVGGITFVPGADSGSGTEFAVLVTSAAHGLSNLDQVNIPDTYDYNGGYEVIRSLTNTFEIAALWVATETGTWDTGSLTEVNKYVNVNRCGAQASSQDFIGAWVSGNAVATSVTGAGTWDPVDFGAIAESQMEGFTVLADGSMRVDTLHPTRQPPSAEMTLIKTGSATPYRFRWFKTTGSDPFPAYYPEHTISAATSSKTVTAPANQSPGDIFRLEVEQVSGVANDFTATHAMITS